jgi:hypothetical protein
MDVKRTGGVGGDDELGRDLRDDGVSEGAQDSHSIGYPIRRHHASGVTSIPAQPGHFAIEAHAWLAVAVGVAHKVNPRARMVFSDTDSRKNRRPDFVTQWTQVIADAIEPSPFVGNLFAKDRSRATCSDEGNHAGQRSGATLRPRAELERA